MKTTQYMDQFLEESKEQLQMCRSLLLELGHSPENLPLIDEVFRTVHTVKGMSAMMGFTGIADLIHRFEYVLEALRTRRLKIGQEILDTAFMTVEQLIIMLDGAAAGETEKLDASQALKRLTSIIDVEDLELKPGLFRYIEKEEPETDVSQKQPSVYQRTIRKVTVTLRKDCVMKSVRVFMVLEALKRSGKIIRTEPSADLLETEKFDRQFTVVLKTEESSEALYEKIMNQSEIQKVDVSEMADEKKDELPTAAHRAGSLPADAQPVRRKTVRVEAEQLADLTVLSDKLIHSLIRLQEHAAELDDLPLIETVDKISIVYGDLQAVVREITHVRAEVLFSRFPALIQQTAHMTSKRIRSQLSGLETEMDRALLEPLSEMLIHLIRNAADHGIELPAERKKNGKPAEGTLVLRAYHDGMHLFVEVEDDGAGVNKKSVLQKALRLNIIAPEQMDKLTDEAVYSIMMSAGFSTAETLSDISGRGVGLDAVKAIAASLGGKVTVKSTEGKGALFSIRIPNCRSEA